MSDDGSLTIKHADDLDLLARCVRAAREEADLDRKGAAREAGYKNMAKGLRRLDKIEAGRGAEPRVLDRFAHALDLDMEAIGERIDARRENRRYDELHRHPPVLGSLLRRARRERDATVDELADAAGLPASRIERIEAARLRFPTDETLESLCEALELPVDRALQARSTEYAYYDGLDGEPEVGARPMPAVSTIVDHPDGLTAEEVVAWATDYARDHDWRIFVVFPDRRTLYITPGVSCVEDAP